MKKSLRHSALSGISWQLVLKFGGTALTALKLFVVARILTPQDFGLFSLTTIALGLTEAATETGINIFLLQKKNRLTEYLDTAWIVAIIRGLLIGAVMLLLSLVMSRFYQEEKLLLLVGLAAFVPIIKGFINPAIVAMHKNLLFFSDSMYHLSLRLVETASAMILVWLSPTIEMLIVSLIVTSCYEVFISFSLFKLRPQWRWQSQKAAQIFAAAKKLNTSAALGYLHENLDNVLLGKLTSTTMLGYYQNSYVLAQKPNYDLARSVHHSLLPIFSGLRPGSNQLRRGFWRACLGSLLLLTVLTSPMLFYPQLVVLWLGSQWQSSVPLIRPLALAGLLQSWSILGYTLFFSQGTYEWVNKHLFWTVVAMVGGILLVTPTYQIVGASWAVAASRLLTAGIIWYGIRATLTKK